MSAHRAAAKAVLAKIRERGGVQNLGHLEAHGLVRQALGVAETSPATWRATRAALDAATAGADEAGVARAIEQAHGDPSPEAGFPASLYGTGPPGKPSQYVTPARRAALLRASPLGRATLAGSGPSDAPKA